MELKNALKSFVGGDDDRAVSPVIGVILMVAITVILAAVIGTFVLGLGDRVSQASPSATFSFDYTAGNNDAVEITHDGGAGIESSQVNISVGGQNAWSSDGPVGSNGFQLDGSDWNGKITAGDKLALAENGDDSAIENGETVKVIWHADGSDKTAVIGESEVNF
ncbi:type IV pilin N-terminal domain-containing protein [Halorussus limi]|uniref:Type IV pilin N-terminal domain-containing protein n=1 Tax=Halorussus limi TaxID=2938695 RepID=A0A8U0HRH1_9EURY|nr:type IV pilin N-terminal domain-containing protein [Halorussus limi]UPV73645.1 type IV pilin N-terminal domain-containing protein [Halorussus limi]